MIDINYIKQNKETFQRQLQQRGCTVLAKAEFKKISQGNTHNTSHDVICLDFILELSECKKVTTQKLEELQCQRNEVSAKMALIKQQQNSNAGNAEETLKETSNQIGISIKSQQIKLEEINAQLKEELEKVPNMLDERVPLGSSENDNAEIKTYGKKPAFNFKPKEHQELGLNLDMLHFDVAAKVSGARMCFLSSDIARLHRALANFMLDTHTRNGFVEMSFPLLVRPSAMFGTGQLSKFGISGDAFYIPSQESHETNEKEVDNIHLNKGWFLLPTGEVSLVNTVSGAIINSNELPIRLVGYSECFRREAGAAGKDTKGMIRQHQFGKVELISVSMPENSEMEHQKILQSAELVLQQLDLHHKVYILCSKDIGSTSKLTYDIEVWMPGQNKYREISSCSNTGDFQSRRMHTRYKQGKQKGYVHTLNGSGLAVGRTLIAIIENYQNYDGSVTVPTVLRQYMGGIEIIKPSNDGIKLSNCFKVK